MDPLTLAFMIEKAKKYWWVVLVVVVLTYIGFLHLRLASKESTIKTQLTTIAAQSVEIAGLKKSIETQNKAIDEWAKKGKEQADQLEQAVQLVQTMKPATQVTIREIYSDKTKQLDDLLRHAKSD